MQWSYQLINNLSSSSNCEYEQSLKRTQKMTSQSVEPSTVHKHPLYRWKPIIASPFEMRSRRIVFLTYHNYILYTNNLLLQRMLACGKRGLVSWLHSLTTNCIKKLILCQEDHNLVRPYLDLNPSVTPINYAIFNSKRQLFELIN